MDESQAADWDLVLSYRAAIEAHETGRDDKRVAAFRSRWLPSGLLPARGKAVRRWLDEAAEAANAALPTGPDSAEEAGLEALARAMRQHGHYPASVVPPEGSTVQVGVSVALWIPDAPVDVRDRLIIRHVLPQGPLGELLWLGWHLSDRFGWDAAHARGWAVCEGALPVVPAIRLRGSGPGFVYPETPNAWSHRVVLDVSLDAPPARVDQELRRLQAANADSGRESSVPRRPISEWALRGAFFAVQHNDGANGWEDVVDLWNESVREPSWRYEGAGSVHLFAKSARRTYAVLMGRPLEWQRKAGERRSK